MILEKNKKSNKFKYKRRRPENTLLYRIVQDNIETVFFNCEKYKKALPQYIKNEFYSFLKCGIAGHGFTRVVCKKCRYEKIIALSCKTRGICPSCVSRRMSSTALFLIENVMPDVPVRQWVISFPFQIRYLMTYNPNILNSVLKIFTRIINQYYIKRAKRFGIENPKTGYVHNIQRFGSGLNLNIHFHSLFLEGVYFENENNSVEFKECLAPKNLEVKRIVKTIKKRVLRYLTKNGFIKKIEDDSNENQFDQDELYNKNPSQVEAFGASIQGVIAWGSNTGKKVEKVGKTHNQMWKPYEGVRCAYYDGFSLHANRRISQGNRVGLLKLCGYLNRPLFAEENLREDIKGNVVLALKKTFSDGTYALKFTPKEFLEKLIALIPPPRKNLIRYGGVLGANSKFRSDIVPKTKVLKDNIDSFFPKIHSYNYWIPWAELMKATFKIDVLECEKCGGSMKVLVFINDPFVAKKILDHLNISSSIPEIKTARDDDEYQYEFF